MKKFILILFALGLAHAAPLNVNGLPKLTSVTDSTFIPVRKPSPDTLLRKFSWGNMRDTVNVLSKKNAQDSAKKIAHDSVIGDTGHFSLVLTGVVGADTVVCKYWHVGSHTHYTIPKVVDTSNATTCTFTGVPAALRPASVINVVVPSIENNTQVDQGIVVVGTAGIIQPKFKAVITNAYTATFTNSGIKGLSDSCEVDYDLQ